MSQPFRVSSWGSLSEHLFRFPGFLRSFAAKLCCFFLSICLICVVADFGTFLVAHYKSQILANLPCDGGRERSNDSDLLWYLPFYALLHRDYVRTLHSTGLSAMVEYA